MAFWTRSASKKNITETETADTFTTVSKVRQSSVDSSGIAGQLFEAIQSGKVKKLAEFIKKGVNITVTDDEGDTLYHSGAGAGQTECLKLLLEANKEMINTKGWKGYTPLHSASFCGREECIQLLLDYDADVNIVSDDGSTTLHMAAKHGFKECCELLLEAEAKIDEQDKEGSTSLILAARFGHVSCVQLLLDRSANINLTMGSLSYTALHWAASNGHYDCVAELAAAESTLMTKDKLGNNAIHLASMNGHSSIVRLLIEKGVNPEEVNNFLETPLHQAASNGHFHTVLVLVLESKDGKVLTMKDDKGLTPLHRAVEGGNLQIVNKILEFKLCDPNAKDNTGNTPLHCAAKMATAGLSDALFNKGVNVDATNDEQLTPLHTAAIFGNLKFVEDILSRGAKVNLRNKEGKDAYDLAVKYGRSDIAALLNKKSNQITMQRQQLAHESTMKLRSDMINLLLENQRFLVKLKIMNRQAELDHLEKQKLMLEISTLKAENSILKEQLQTAKTPPVTEKKSEERDVLEEQIAAQPEFPIPVRIARSSRRATNVANTATMGQSFDLLQTQNQVLRSKVLNLTEEVSMLENQILTLESKRQILSPTSLRFGGHRKTSDPNSTTTEEEDFFKGESEHVLFSKEAGEAIPQIKAATPDKLVERLTYQKYPDVEYMNAFLLTYRSFMSPLELIEKLMLRYCLTPPESLREEEQVKNFSEKIQMPVRLRVVNVVKHWIEDHFYDFEESEELETEILKFFSVLEKTGFDKQADQLRRGYERKSEQKTIRTASPSGLIPPTIPVNSDKFIDWNDLEIARQITLLDFEIYRAIVPKECLNQAWMKNGGVNAPNIKSLVNNFNKLGNWVWNEILLTKELKERVALVTKFINIAKNCFSMNNYNSALCIMSGVQNFTVHRLKKTWDELDKSSKDVFEELTNIMSSRSNWTKYRDHLHNKTTPPCVPFLGMYLTDLVFIEEGNPDRMKMDLVNFFKRRKISIIIREIQQYQLLSYNYAVVPQIREYLMSREPTMTEEAGYKVSLELEPKES